jgi:Tfp pilus assembly protein PilP
MSALDLINKYAITAKYRRQTTDGSFVENEFVAGTVVETDFLISVQPLNGRELLNFPEAQRSRQFLKGYTATELKTVDESNKRKADLVIAQGKTYEVQMVEYWNANGTTLVPYWKVYLAEINPEDTSELLENPPELFESPEISTWPPA